MREPEEATCLRSSPDGATIVRHDEGSEYSNAFYDRMQGESLESARTVVPLVMQLVRPRRVVDLGCGIGTWLSVFKQLGVEEIRGVDGAWVDRSRLQIPVADFEALDLEGALDVRGAFDLSVSVEVAEHLPPPAGDRLVEALTRLAPVVLFSAAIPHQGGVHHVNEQWQSYWIERFETRGFVPVDCLRRRLWDEEAVAGYYAQNIFLFVERRRLPGLPALREVYEAATGQPVRLVHPTLYLEMVDRSRKGEDRINELEQECEALRAVTPGHISLRRVLGAMPALAVHALRRRLAS